MPYCPHIRADEKLEVLFEEKALVGVGGDVGEFSSDFIRGFIESGFLPWPLFDRCRHFGSAGSIDGVLNRLVQDSLFKAWMMMVQLD
jgi:hypothetical protein